MDKYRIIVNDSLIDFEKNVNNRINMGYTPIGGVTIDKVNGISIYYQAIIKI